MKKVLHLSRKLLAPTASFIRNQILSHNEYKAHVAYAEKIPGKFYDEISKQVKCLSVTDTSFSKILYSKYRKLNKTAKHNLENFINEINPNIIHSHYGVDTLVYETVLNKFNIPTVVSFYGYDCTMFPKRFGGFGKYWLNKSIFKNPKITKVFAMTEDMKKDLIKLGCPEEKIIVHYYGTDSERFIIQREYLSKDEINLLIISGLFHKKGHIFLLQAFNEAQSKTNNKIRLTIVGDGDLKQEIENFIRKNSIANVKLLGSVEYGSRKHFSLLREADIFIHPSITPPSGDKEGIPGAIIEAMAGGLPVISTFHAGIPYVVKNNISGILVEEKNVEQLTNAIIKLAEDDKLREYLGKNAQNYAVNELGLSNKEKELEHFYDNIISEYSAKLSS